MLGILYLCLCFTVGYVICSLVFPKLSDILKAAYRGKEIQIHRFLLCVPAWYFTGTLFMTGLTYILGCVFRNNRHPLLGANAVVMIIAFLVTVFGIVVIQKKNIGKMEILNTKNKLSDFVFIFFAAILTSVLMWQTFYVTGGVLKVGLSVFSDFSPHLLMIRSFSYGNNFPTTYGHFAGGDIRYHFMFQFLAGNLEFLGLRIDYAFNLPSTLSLISVFSLLYVLAVKITGSKIAAWLAGLFFAFRSSPSLFKYIAGIPKGSVIGKLNDNIEFIGETVNEGWGLWNLNVYVNQRHLAFSLSIMLFVVIMFLPLFYSHAERISAYIAENRKEGLKNVLFTPISRQRRHTNQKCEIAFYFTLIPDMLKKVFLEKEAWLPKNIITAAVLGIILGLSAFFNGAVLICTLFILFFMAAFSDRRLEYLIAAVIAAVLSFLQSGFFIDGNAVTPKYLFGFIAPNKTFFGVMEYIFELTGIFFIVLFAVLLLLKSAERYLVLVFLVPFIAAFTLSFTPDVTVNHKNIMLSIMLMGIFNAWLIDMLIKKKGIFNKAAAIFIVIVLTATGIYDFTVVMKRNADNWNLAYDMKDEITLWVKENASSQDIFLSHNYYLNSLVLGGAMLYDGWQYYTWSAGYDTFYRDQKVNEMYGAESAGDLEGLIKENNIRFIVIDYNNRTSSEYVLNEELIDNTYGKVFETGSNEYRFVIYDTSIELLN